MVIVTSVTVRSSRGQGIIFSTVTSMKKLKFLVSLTTNDNDYQIEQAAAAEEAARRLGADVQIIYAENDSITQSQQILSVIQSRSDSHPDGIIFEPVGGTALPQVARAAVAAGISWVVLNRNVDYIAELRKNSPGPDFWRQLRPRRNRPYPGTSVCRASAQGRNGLAHSGTIREPGRQTTHHRHVRDQAGRCAGKSHAGAVDGRPAPIGR